MSRIRLRPLAALVAAGLVTTGLVGLATAGAPPAAAAPTTCVSSGAPRTFLHGRADVLDTSAQVLPAVPQTGAGTAALCAARDAYASFQLEVTATDAQLANVRITSSNLVGPGGAVLPGTSSATRAVAPNSAGAPDVTLSREDYTTLTTMTDGDLSGVIARDPHTGACQGAVGHPGDCRFPDALVPDRDTLVGAPRAAFPLTVPAGENRVVWVDVFVPADTTPGPFAGTVTITGGATSELLASVHVDLTVLDTTLPATSSLHSGFMVKTYGGTTTSALYQQYAELGLNDRMSLSPDGIPTGNAAGTLASLIDGTDPVVRVRDADGTGARLTDILGTTAADFAATRRELPVDDRAQAWSYCEEATASTCQKGYTTAAHGSVPARAAWPQVPRAVIDDYQDGKYPDPETAGVTFPSLVPQPRTAIVIAQQLDPRGTTSRAPQFAAWAASQSRQSWVYTSCISGGCGSPYGSDPTLAGWPGYSIDEPSSEQSATGWLLYAADTAGDSLDGELYYEVRQTTPTVISPGVWSSAYSDGTNGDGTLFYPYNAAEVGGGPMTPPVPLESLRLKRFRDGRQDYELLRLAGKSFGVPLVRSTFASWHDADISGAQLDASTEQLYDHFLPVAGAAPASPTAIRLHPVADSGEQVSWTSPSDGGSAITGYQVTASPVGSAAAGDIISSCTSTSTSCAITGLPPATTYSFTVRARNLAGEGSPSATATAVTPEPPAARTALTLTSPSTATYGATVRISARLTRADTHAGISGARVQLQARRAGTGTAYHPVGVTVTTTSGSAAAAYRPAYPVQIRFVFGGTSSYLGSTSRSQVVDLYRVLTLHAKHSRTRSGHRNRLTGSCTPSCAGRAVHLQRLSHGRWVAVKAGHAARNGSYSFSLHVRTRGRTVYRVRVVGGSGYLTTVSTAHAVRVT